MWVNQSIQRDNLNYLAEEYVIFILENCFEVWTTNSNTQDKLAILRKEKKKIQNTNGNTTEAQNINSFFKLLKLKFARITLFESIL